MLLRKFVVSNLIVAAVLTALSGHMSFGQEAANPEAPDAEEMKAMMETGQKIGQLQQMAYSPKIAEELELAPDQKKKILIVLQNYQDVMLKIQQDRPKDQAAARKIFLETADKVLQEVSGILTEKQSEKLTELAKKATKALPQAMSQEKMQEMQKLNSVMQELMRISYDQELADKLEITPEQRVDIREAQQEFQRAMQERTQASQGATFDMDSYNEMIGKLVMDAQDILTPDQTEKLSRIAKRNVLKQTLGDSFAMINGLAKDFDLDEAEAKKLKEKIDEVRESYYDKLQDLRRESMDKIIRELPQKHREEVEDAVQDFIEEDPRKKRGFGVPLQ